MAKVIIFVGTPGAGKSSILKGVHHRHKLVNIGTAMFEIAGKEYKVASRDDMRKLSPEIQYEIRKRVFSALAKEKDDVILDTHASVRSGPRFVPGFTLELLSTLNELRTIVYIDASSKDIMSRRSKDLTRRRDIEDEVDLEEQREINISLISTASATFGIPIHIIKNNEGSLKGAIRQANEIVVEMFK